MASASATVLAIGFSTSTCLPASSAATAISAWVSPGVQMSTTSTSSRSIARRQSVSTASQPSWAAAAVARSSSRPTSTAMCGSSGRSKNRWALRHAWEWARPMKAYPIIATPSRGLSSVIETGSLTVRVRGPGAADARSRAPGGSGRERGVDVLVDVLRGHNRRVELDQARDLDLDEVAHALLLGEQPGQPDTVGGLAGRVDHRGLEDGVAGLDVAHRVGRAGAADHEELVAAGVLDGGHDAQALVVIVVPDRVDLGQRLEQARGHGLTTLRGELRGDPVGHRETALAECVLKALAAVLGQRQVVDTGDLGDDGVRRSEENTSELQSRGHLVCRLLLDNKNDRVIDDHYVEVI